MTLPPLFSCCFPTYIKDCSNNEVDVLWYHPDFSQSRYPPGQERSEACTLICLLVAVRIARENLLIYNIESCPQLNVIVAEAMIEGNETHAWLITEGLLLDPYLSTEEALKYGGNSLNTLKEWKFNVFHEEIETSLYKNINIFLHNWYRAPKSHTLFMLLITCGRTVLFIFQGSTYKVTLFDSHSHTVDNNSSRGLVIAQVSKFEVYFYTNIWQGLSTIVSDKYVNYSSANKLWKCTMCRQLLIDWNHYATGILRMYYRIVTIHKLINTNWPSCIHMAYNALAIVTIFKVHANIQKSHKKSIFITAYRGILLPISY